MPPLTRALVLGALVLGFTPALAHACDDERAKSQTTASATATSTVTSSSSATRCGMKVKTVCGVKPMVTVENKGPYKFDFNFNFNFDNATEGVRGSGWTPGHLIDHDSMKFDPAQDDHSASEWVTISFVNGSLYSIKKAERAKKAHPAGKSGGAGPTVQSAPNPF